MGIGGSTSSPDYEWPDFDDFISLTVVGGSTIFGNIRVKSFHVDNWFWIAANCSRTEAWTLTPKRSPNSLTSSKK